jgi:ABC-2 type transport system permease protein
MNGFTGTGALFRLALRRDRIIAAIWILGIAVMAYSQGASLVAVYPTAEDLARFAANSASGASSPASLAFAGPLYDATSLGGLTAWQAVTTQAVLIGLMSIFLVTRHTRAEEETGRAELVSATVVGRHAWLAASLLWVLAVNVVLIVVTVLLFLSIDLPLGGSVAEAVGCGLAGMVFAAVAAVTAQVTEHGRTANGLAAATLGLAFLLRAVGDASAGANLSWLTWTSPIGWAQEVRSFADERWWVLLLPLALIALLLAVVRVLVAHRDVGGGMLPQRLGPAAAPAGLGSAFGLAWRLQRGSIVGWSAGMGVAGLSMGLIAQDMLVYVKDDPTMADGLARLGGRGGDVVDIFLAAIYSLIGIAVAGYVVQATLRLRQEETAFRAEPVLATAVRRGSWVVSHLLCVAIGSVIVLAAAGLGGGLAHALRAEDFGVVPDLLGAALVQAPAAWVLGGLGAALFGLLPRLTVAAWGAVALALVVGQFGDVLRLDQAVKDLSPFTHLPRLPGVEVTATPLLWLLAVALALAVAGLAGFRRRDVG